MKKLAFILLTFLAFADVKAQIVDPVTWTTRTERISETEFNLVFEAVIEAEWHVYSQFTPEGGPLPLTLIFQESNGNFNVVGKAKESTYKKQFNDIFEVDEYYFEKQFSLRQKIKILNPGQQKSVSQSIIRFVRKSASTKTRILYLKFQKLPLRSTLQPSTRQPLTL